MKRFATITTLALLLAFGAVSVEAAPVEMDALRAMEGDGEQKEAGPAGDAAHVVVRGDTLRGIAARYLGDPDRWPEIYEANKDQIADPHWIYPGQSFVIPGGHGGSNGGGSSSGGGGTVAASGGASAGNGDKPYNNKLPLPKGTYQVTSRYGMRDHPISGERKMHGGIDLGAGLGTPVHATGAGTIITASSGENGGYGNYIRIRHDDGTVTVYAHLQSGSLKVRQGQRVEAGAHIAGVNSTGSSTGNHLHFEVRPGGTNTADPARFWSF